MGRFDRQIASAEKQIAKNGQSVVWRQVNKGTPADPDKPWKPSVASDTDKSVVICFLPVNRVNQQLFAYLRGTNDIPQGNVMGLMKGNVDFTPKPKDVVVRDGETYRIKSIEPLSPNGQKLLYTIEFEA